ncbi:2521_t:CDS:2 [Funneliformis geosporum]|nr:2521_t:CDS:2 [Funneliformis geosporum]
MSQTILLLKEKTIQTDSNIDVYEQKFNELGEYTILYLPVLEHSLVNINELTNILKNGIDNQYGGVIATSQRAVEGLKVAWDQILSSGERIDVLEKWKKIPYFVVGKSTAKAVREMFEINSLGADESGNSESLADYIIEYFNSIRGKGPHNQRLKLLFLVGDKRREELPNKLSKSGISLKELRIYETKPNSSFSTELDKISKFLVEKKKTINWITFFSPSGVDNSLELLKVNLLKDWDK